MSGEGLPDHQAPEADHAAFEAEKAALRARIADLEAEIAREAERYAPLLAELRTMVAETEADLSRLNALDAIRFALEIAHKRGRPHLDGMAASLERWLGNHGRLFALVALLADLTSAMDERTRWAAACRLAEGISEKLHRRTAADLLDVAKAWEASYQRLLREWLFPTGIVLAAAGAEALEQLDLPTRDFLAFLREEARRLTRAPFADPRLVSLEAELPGRDDEDALLQLLAAEGHQLERAALLAALGSAASSRREREFVRHLERGASLEEAFATMRLAPGYRRVMLHRLIQKAHRLRLHEKTPDKL